MTAALKDWAFGDESANGTVGMINRQKSAGNLVLLALDPIARTGRFLDRERKTQSITSLTACDCRDFLFVGKSPRKTFQPCKHVYRLAMELGLLEPRYLDHEARESLRARGLGELKRCEDDRLVSLGRDPAAWGRWPAAVHDSGLQRNRQYRAYFILDDEPESVREDGRGWRIREYTVTLEVCDCPDFQDRSLPCKHVYVAALQGGLHLPLTRSDYAAARKQGLEIVFVFENERLDALSRL